MPSSNKLRVFRRNESETIFELSTKVIPQQNEIQQQSAQHYPALADEVRDILHSWVDWNLHEFLTVQWKGHGAAL